MKIYIKFLVTCSLMFGSFTQAQVLVDTGDCKIQIPSGYQLLLETNSNERAVFGKTSDLSTINFSVNKSYLLKNSEKVSYLKKNDTAVIIAKTEKYVVVNKTRTVGQKKFEFTLVYLNGLMISIIGSDAKNWRQILESCK